MDWRLAHSLEQLRIEVNVKYPNRSKASDGSIGDANHASRTSDHNPWITDAPGPNVVSAIDITHDPKGGFDSYAFAEWLRTTCRDKRLKYFISNRKICAGAGGPSPWVWRPYHGANPHDHHVHISVDNHKILYDSTATWGVVDGAQLPKHSIPQPKPVPQTLKRQAKGDDVKMLQETLTNLGINVKVDGDFGNGTFEAVEKFQKAHGLHADGVVGPQTWKALLGIT